MQLRNHLTIIQRSHAPSICMINLKINFSKLVFLITMTCLHKLFDLFQTLTLKISFQYTNEKKLILSLRQHPWRLQFCVSIRADIHCHLHVFHITGKKLKENDITAYMSWLYSYQTHTNEWRLFNDRSNVTSESYKVLEHLVSCVNK